MVGYLMAEDRLRRGAIKPPHKKPSEPFIQIPSGVLNSAAYTDLSYSARAVLIEVLHFYRGNNNGSIWMTSETVIKRGLSKNTMTKAMKELITHGLVYQTRRGGSLSGVCSLFAITWKRINKAEGQFLSQFVSNAYLNWRPSLEKIEGSKIGRGQTQNWEYTPKETKPRQSKGMKGNLSGTRIKAPVFPVIGSYLDMPYIQLNNPLRNERTNSSNWMAQDQKRLNKVGLVGLQSYQIPTIH
jgi:hypothetical protein